MSRSAVVVLFLVVAVIFPGMAAPVARGDAQHATLRRDDRTAVLRGTLDRIATETAALRSLAIGGDVSPVFVTREELRQEAAAELAARYPMVDAEADARVLAVFGLAPPDLDLQTESLDAYVAWLTGSYDSETERIRLIGDDQHLDASEEVVYAHEVAHALQDEAFDLDALVARVETAGSADATLALKALIEGDATAVEADYMRVHPDLSARIRHLGMVADGDASSDWLPSVVTQVRDFPYSAGHRFVRYLYLHGGWPAVDAAFADPPASTEQILHPDRYLDRDPPTRVELPDLGPTLGAAWRPLAEDTLGELKTTVFFADWGDGLAAYRAATGWDGDRFVAWAAQDRTVLIWESVWDTQADAAEFARAIEEREAYRFDGEFEQEFGASRALATDEVVVRVDRLATRVRYVQAPDRALATKVAETLGPLVASVATSAATPAPGAPAAFTAAPALDRCRVDRRTLASVRALLGTAPASPATDHAVASAPEPGDDLPAADAATVAGITATIEEEAACINADDWPRALALSTDDDLRRYWAWYWPPTNADLVRMFGTPRPYPVDQRSVIVEIRDIHPLPDGRVGALYTRHDPLVEFGQPSVERVFAVFLRVGDRWLIDESYYDP